MNIYVSFFLSLYLSVSVIIIFQCLLLVSKSFSCVSVALLFFLIFLLSCVYVYVWCHNKRNTHETCMDVRTRATADINHISIVKCVVRVWATQRYVKNKDAQFIHKNFLRSHAVRCSLFIHYALHDFFLSFFSLLVPSECIWCVRSIHTYIRFCMDAYLCASERMKHWQQRMIFSTFLLLLLHLSASLSLLHFPFEYVDSDVHITLHRISDCTMQHTQHTQFS